MSACYFIKICLYSTSNIYYTLVFWGFKTKFWGGGVINKNFKLCKKKFAMKNFYPHLLLFLSFNNIR